MPDMAYMIPLDQRRRLAELYGDTQTSRPEGARGPDHGSPGVAVDAAAGPTGPVAAGNDPGGSLPAGNRCVACGYRFGSIGHQTACDGQPPSRLRTSRLTGYADGQPVTFSEHDARISRVRSVPCPNCLRSAGQPCADPSGFTSTMHHQARWDAYYASQRSTP